MDQETIVQYIADTFAGVEVLRPDDGPGAGDGCLQPGEVPDAGDAFFRHLLGVRRRNKQRQTHDEGGENVSAHEHREYISGETEGVTFYIRGHHRVSDDR